MTAVDDDLIRRMMRLFEGHPGVHGTHGNPERSADDTKWEIHKTARTLRSPADFDAWKNHLSGGAPLGVVPISPEGNVHWSTMDVDKYDIDIPKIAKKIEKLPLLPVRSKSAGLHLFAFWREPESAEMVIANLRLIAMALGIGHCEIFPKQTSIITERGDMGNWIVMPYCENTFGGKLSRQVAIDPEGNELSLAEFVERAEKLRVSLKDFVKIVNEHFNVTKPAPTPKTNPRLARINGDDDGPPSPCNFSDGPPCIEHMIKTQSIAEGGRNNVLLMAGIYFKRADPENWRVKLENFNSASMNSSLSAREVLAVIQSLERKAYHYTCKAEPMASYCNSTLCRVRRFGVGDAPPLTEMAMLPSDPPVWFINVGDKRICLEPKDLLTFPAFQHACLIQANAYFPAMKQIDWQLLMRDMTDKATPIEISSDLTREGIFKQYLEQFCGNRRAGKVRDDIARGVPWEDQVAKKWWFRLQDLYDFLLREGIKNYTRVDCTVLVRALGGDRVETSIRGKGANLWWVPSDVLTPALIPEAPALPESPI